MNDQYSKGFCDKGANGKLVLKICILLTFVAAF